jgi:hypothetical protein
VTAGVADDEDTVAGTETEGEPVVAAGACDDTTTSTTTNEKRK